MKTTLNDLLRAHPRCKKEPVTFTSDVEQRKQRSQNNRLNKHNGDKTKKNLTGSYTEVNPHKRFDPRTCGIDHFICQLNPGHPNTVFPGNGIMKTVNVMIKQSERIGKTVKISQMHVFR